MKVFIVEDEELAVKKLRKTLESVDNTAEVVGVAESIRASVNWLQNNPAPDLILMDIELCDGQSFEIFDKVDVKSTVIFTTSYDEYALRAFKVNSVDYLLKPIDADDLLQAVNKLQKILDQQQLTEKFSALFHNLKAADNTSKRITVATNKGLLFLQISDIVRCEADVNYTTIFLKDKQQIMVAKTLKEFEDMLSDHNFFRIHNSHLINMDYIKSYHKGKGGYVTLADNTSLEVSTRRRDLFLKRIEEM